MNKYPVGKTIVVPATVPDGKGDVMTEWKPGQVVSHFQNRVSHECHGDYHDGD